MSESSKTRRDFLRTGAAAAAAASLAGRTRDVEAFEDAAPAPHAPKRRPLPDDEPILIAVIGTGGMGTAHCDAFVRFASDKRANVRVAAIADVCEPRLTAAKARVEKVQGPETVQTYGDYREILARQDIHANQAVVSGKPVEIPAFA